MKKILIGYIGKGKTSGIDKYLLNFADKIKNEETEIDFLTRFYDDELEQYLKSKNYNLFHVSRNRHFIKQFREMKRIIKSNDYDIAYFNISESYNCVGLLAAKIFGIKKIIAHSHNSDATSNKKLVKRCKRFLNKMFKPVLHYCANQYLACSDLAAKWLFPKKIYETEKYELIYNAVDFDKFKYNEKTRTKIRKKLKIDNKFVLGFVGRFNHQKNTKFLVDILFETIQSKKNAILLCVGEGEEMEKFKKYAKQKNVLDNIVFAGVVDNSWDYYQAFDVFLLPSLYEGLPIVGVEAQISGCPCIFSDRITKEVIIGKNSHHVSIKNSIKWKDIICKINKRDNKLLKSAENFDLNNSKQFNKIIDENHYDKSDKSPILVLFYLLSLHYLLNLTNYFNGFNLLLIPCAFLMFAISIYYLKIYKQLLKEKTWLIILIFLLDYVLTFILTEKYNITGSIKHFIWTIILCLFVFGYKRNRDKKMLKYELKHLAIWNIILISLINLANYTLLLLNVKDIIKSLYGDYIVFGMSSWQRFYGLYYDPNYASVVSGCAILFSIYLLRNTRKVIYKTLLIISIYLQTIFILYGQSRTGLLCVGVGLFSMLGMNLYHDIQQRDVKKYILKFLCIVVFIGLTLTSVKVINRYCLSSQNEVTSTHSSKKNKKTSEEIDIFKRKDINNGDISNRRFSIWESGMEIFNKNKIVGIGFSNIEGYAKDKVPKTYIVSNDFAVFAAFHNVFIDVIVSQGIIGAMLLFMFVMLIITKTIKNIKKITNSSLLIMLISCVILIASSSMFVSEILYINNACSFMFWLVLGYYYYMLEKVEVL